MRIDVTFVIDADGALAVQAGGLDALVFTAGTGQRSAPVREKILARLAWLGFDLDADANQRAAVAQGLVRQCELIAG